jgi:hypothetical protein
MLHAFVNITTKESTSTPLIVFQAEPVFSYDLIDHQSMYESLRPTSMIAYVANFTSYSEGPVYLRAVFNYNSIVRVTAEYSIITIIYNGILLVLGSVINQTDAQKLVITPIERMMNMVEAVSIDPLTPFQFPNFGDKDNKAGEKPSTNWIYIVSLYIILTSVDGDVAVRR